MGGKNVVSITISLRRSVHHEVVSILLYIFCRFQSIHPQEFLLKNGEKVTLYFTVSSLRCTAVVKKT